MQNSLDDILLQLAHLAHETCHEIIRFQPDLVIGLAHSGWLPVQATRAWWEAWRKKFAFPATIRSNIGLEKVRIYCQRFPEIPPAYCCEDFFCSEDIQRGHLMHWVSGQVLWLAQLRSQVRAALGGGRTPQRVLIVDEFSGSGRTAMLSLCVAKAAFPQAEVCFIAGKQDWTNLLLEAWLEEFAPPLLRELRAAFDPACPQIRYPDPRYELLKPLVTGSEDRAPDSLDWKPLSVLSPAVEMISPHVPLLQALAAPAWVEHRVIEYLLSRPPVLEPLPQEDILEPFPIRLCFLPEFLLLAEAWKPGGLSLARAQDILNSSQEETHKMLQGYVDRMQLEALPVEGSLRYFPDPNYR